MFVDPPTTLYDAPIYRRVRTIRALFQGSWGSELGFSILGFYGARLLGLRVFGYGPADLLLGRDTFTLNPKHYLNPKPQTLSPSHLRDSAKHYHPNT